MTHFELQTFYRDAKRIVEHSGFSHEIAWVEQLRGWCYAETDLLRESAWVILCSGFREAVVRSKFLYISLCFSDWESARAIVDSADLCKRAAGYAFQNNAKLSAIVEVAKSVATHGFVRLKQEIDREPIAQLQRFPYIGSVTAQHLAKNLGYPFAKNDRHLARLARRFGFPDAQNLCETVAVMSGDAISVVDTVLWRFCTFGSVAVEPSPATR